MLLIRYIGKCYLHWWIIIYACDATTCQNSDKVETVIKSKFHNAFCNIMVPITKIVSDIHCFADNRSIV